MLDDFELQFLSHLDDVLDVFRAAPGKLTDVDHAVFAAQKLRDGADTWDDADNFCIVDGADFGLGDDALDPLLRLLHRFAVCGSDEDQSAVLDIDFDPQFARDLLDHFTTLADDQADVVVIDLVRL